MAYIGRKIKTRKRIKQKQKQRRLRNRTFRKSRRVNRGGTGTGKRAVEDTMENKWKDTRTAKETAEQNAIEKEKDEEIAIKRVANIRSNMYLMPEVTGVSVNQTKKLKITEDQQRFMDDIDAEEVPGGTEGGIWFGGKKKRFIKKK